MRFFLYFSCFQSGVRENSLSFYLGALKGLFEVGFSLQSQRFGLQRGGPGNFAGELLVSEMVSINFKSESVLAFSYLYGITRVIGSRAVRDEGRACHPGPAWGFLIL